MLVTPVEFFLESVDRAAQSKLSSVVQLVGVDDRGIPGGVGSAVLLEVDGVKLLVTAAHVITDWAPVSSLYIPGASGLVGIDGPKFRLEKTFDIGVAVLPDPLVQELRAFTFLKETECRSIGILGPASYVVALGYPATRNSARWGHNSIRNAPYSIGGTRLPSSIRDIRIHYSKRKNRTSKVRQKIIGPDLHGMSGGGMFATRVSLSPELFLVGITTDWLQNKSEVKGCGWPVVVQFIRAVLRERFS